MKRINNLLPVLVTILFVAGLTFPAFAAPPRAQIKFEGLEDEMLEDESTGMDDDIPGGFEPPPLNCQEGQMYRRVEIDWDNGATQHTTLKCLCGAWYPTVREVYDDNVCDTWGLMYYKQTTWMPNRLKWGVEDDGVTVKYNCDVLPIYVKDQHWTDVRWPAGVCPLAGGGSQPFSNGCVKLYDIHRRLIMYRTNTYTGIFGNLYETMQVVSDDTDSYGTREKPRYCSDQATIRRYSTEAWGTITTNNLTSGLPIVPTP